MDFNTDNTAIWQLINDQAILCTPEITFSNTSVKMDTMKPVQIPFQTDDQYNILANLQVGKSDIKNILT